MATAAVGENAAETLAPPPPAQNSSFLASLFEGLFGFLFGWFRSDSTPKAEASVPQPLPTPDIVINDPPPPSDPVADDPEEDNIPAPTPEEVPAPEEVIIDDSQPDPAPVAEDTPQEDAPQDDPADEVPDDAGNDVEEPGTIQDPAPEVPEVPVKDPDPDVAEDPAPDVPAPNAPDPDTPDTPAPDMPAPVSVARQIAPATLDSGATVNVAGGRVTTFALPDADDITGVTITGLPAHGNVTVNPDFTFALVLSGSNYSGPLSFEYAVSKADGTVTTQTATLNVATPTQAAGWGLGNHYMLATDANDNVVVEHGDNHRKVYISGSEEALSRSDIAALEGVSESVITTQWLRDNPEYGGSEDMALATNIGMDLWYSVTAKNEGPTSHWLLFERGYEYADTGPIINRGSNGESELTPLYVSSWGDGAQPVLGSQISFTGEARNNVVFADVELGQSVRILAGSNFLFDSVAFSGKEAIIQAVDPISYVTIKNSVFADIIQDSPTNGGQWSAHQDRESGIFASGIDGLLMEGNLFVGNGWAEGYDGTLQGGQPPSMYSHNVYLQWNTSDVTFRDNISAQGASFGVQVRSGGHIEGNLLLDNNVAANFLGGDYEGRGPVGEYTLLLDNVVTSAALKDAQQIGAKDWGLRNEGRDSTLLNNIVVHKANPDDPDEMAFKASGSSNPVYNKHSAFFDDTIVYNWSGHEANLDGLDQAALNQITIQNFAMEFLGLDPSTAPANQNMGLYYESGLINALMDYARENWGDGTLTTRDIIDWFQAGFGFDPRTQGATDHRFIPNDLGDGVRWDNRLNWSSDQLPTNGDDVDLGGNWVNFGGTVALDSLDLGSGGKLQVGSGKLSVGALDTGANGGTIFVERAGQFWTDGYGGDTLLSLQVTGGRFANTGDVSGPVIASVTGGQMIVAADNAQFILGQQSELRIEGSAAKVGFDGGVGGVATLIMQDGGQMSFVADSAGLTSLREFRSGAWDQEGSNVHSGVALNGTLALDLSSYNGTGSIKLIEVDAIAGMFDAINIHGLGNRNAELVIDYAADLVMLELSNGNGQGSVTIKGDATYGGDENAALWDALTSGLDLGAGPDAQITIFDDAIDPLAEMSFI